MAAERIGRAAYAGIALALVSMLPAFALNGYAMTAGGTDSVTPDALGTACPGNPSATHSVGANVIDQSGSIRVAASACDTAPAGGWLESFGRGLGANRSAATGYVIQDFPAAWGDTTYTITVTITMDTSPTATFATIAQPSPRVPGLRDVGANVQAFARFVFYPLCADQSRDPTTGCWPPCPNGFAPCISSSSAPNVIIAEGVVVFGAAHCGANRDDPKLLSRRDSGGSRADRRRINGRAGLGFRVGRGDQDPDRGVSLAWPHARSGDQNRRAMGTAEVDLRVSERLACPTAT
jgi:hypothetical protein